MPNISSMWGTLKLHADQIRQLRGRLDSFSIGSQVIVNGGSGVLLSDADPLPVGAVADPGDGTTASRWNHVHEGGIVGQYLQFTYTNDNPFLFVVDGSGQPVFALMDLQ